MSRTAKLYLLALVVAVPALQVSAMPLLMMVGPIPGILPWGFIIIYLLLVILIKYLLEKTTIFAAPRTQTSPPVDPRVARRSKNLQQYALAVLVALVLSYVLMPLLGLPLMMVEIGFFESEYWRILMPLFKLGLFIALTMLCKLVIEKVRTTRQSSTTTVPDITVVHTVEAESAPPVNWQASVAATPPPDDRLRKVKRTSVILSVACSAGLAALMIIIRGMQGEWYLALATAAGMIMPTFLFAALLYPGFKSILSLRLGLEPPRQLLKHLLYALCLLLLICALCPLLWTPSILATTVFALIFWLLCLRGSMPHKILWRRIAFIAASVAAIGVLFSAGPVVDREGFDRVDWVTAYAVTVIAVGLVFCVSLYNQLSRGERIGCLLLILLTGAGLFRVADLPFLHETHNLTGCVTVTGTPERAGTKVELVGTFTGREWLIAQTISDSDGRYWFSDAKEYVTLVEGKKGIDHGCWSCMGGVHLRFTREGFEPFILREEMSGQPSMVVKNGVSYLQMTDVQLQQPGARATMALPFADRQYLSSRGLSGDADDRRNWEMLRRDQNAPRDEIEARIIACRFAEAESTLFLDEIGHRQAYRRVIEDASAWLAANHESPHRMTVLTAKAGAHFRCGELALYRETTATLQRFFPSDDWRRQLAAMEARP